jgi:hypothetical protein
VSLASFAEDVWLCLGFPIGAILETKPDLPNYSELLISSWRPSLETLQECCLQSIDRCRNVLSQHYRSQKEKALAGGLLLLEVSHLQILRDLSQCNCRESALELWSGRYQLRYLPESADRVRQCAFDVTLGCVNVPYGMEYQGGTVQMHLGADIEYAIQKTIGSAFSFRGTVFVCYESDDSGLEVEGEFAVNLRNVAVALGRVQSVLTAVQSLNSAKLFLARLIYLDAVGCIDFTTLDEPGMQIVVDALSQMWTAIEKKDDFFVIGSLKYPLKTSAIRNNVSQLTRRKSDMSSLLHGINAKGGVYSGLFLIGMASETLYCDESVFNHFSNSVFNMVSICYNTPVHDLSTMLALSGFSCGALIQELFEQIHITLQKSRFKGYSGLKALVSTRMVRELAKEAGRLLSVERYSRSAANQGRDLKGFILLRFELEVFVNTMWGIVRSMLLAVAPSKDMDDLRALIVHKIQDHLDLILAEKDRFPLNECIQEARELLTSGVETAIKAAASSLNVVADAEFMHQCCALWEVVCSRHRSLGILFGASATGKSTLRATVLLAMRKFSGLDFLPAPAAGSNAAVASWKAAMMLTRIVRRWRARRDLLMRV